MTVRARLAAALIAAAVLLTGCAGTDAHGNMTPKYIAPHYVDLPDGRAVLCVWEMHEYAGGLSCDWSTAHVSTAPPHTPDPLDQPTPGDTLDKLTDWDIDAELDGVSGAPAHETAAVLRMKRNGWPGPAITEHFDQPALHTVDQLAAALDGEEAAAFIDRPIHDARIDPEDYPA